MKLLSSEELIKNFCQNDLIKLEDLKEYEKILTNKKYISINFDTKSRLELINLAIKKTSAKSYLEIGCDKDEIFSQIEVKHKVGVDLLKGGTLRMTSDWFFVNNTQTFDVIFIDGLHYYDQTRRDIIHSMKFLNKDGIIIIHDMLPITEKQTRIPLPSSWFPSWLGDVYKLNFDLCNNENFDFHIVKTDLGCGIISNLNNTSPNITASNIDWSTYVANFSNLPLISFLEAKELLS
jgi:predicted O-methyltransferase YrrM